MEIGWVDFSKDDRNKVLNVLDLLGEKGVLDELGIGSIRDAYSDLFFPGTSTVQTRAKYFLIVPYALKDLDYVNSDKYGKLLNDFHEKEKRCANIFYDNNPEEKGIIGKTKIHSGKWVQRAPSNVYLAGMSKYKILNYNFSINHIIKRIAIQKQEKRDIISLGNANDKNESIADDKDAGVNQFFRFLNIPTYRKDWLDNLEMNLTYDESQFLKNQIISTCSDSMLAFILENDFREVLEFDSFKDLKSIEFPTKIQEDYNNALAFSEFVYALRIIYNLKASNHKNKKANILFEDIKDNLDSISNIDVNKIMYRLNINNSPLNSFLNDAKQLMREGDIEEIENLLMRREINLKSKARSKLFNPEKNDIDEWHVGERLDYRFGIAKTILSDIFESEGGDLNV